MKPIKLILNIDSITEASIRCCAVNSSDKVYLIYNLHLKELSFECNNHLADVIRKFQFQFEKVIISALNRPLKVGQKINCVFIDGFKFLNESAYNDYIRLDRRNKDFNISISQTATEKIYRIYTDGSFANNSKTSGYGGIIENIHGERQIFSRSFQGGSSNLMELLAVLDGLKRLQSIDQIQINTDSRYVIRGMVQWVHFWKYNDWQTAYGTKVKFVDYWKQIDTLSDNKLIEFNWIKGHSGHLDQDFCHRLAKSNAQTTEKR